MSVPFAYAKIEGPGIIDYVQAKLAYLGRQPSEMKDEAQIICIGTDKKISRNHMTLEYKIESGRWAVTCNGLKAVVNGVELHKDESKVLSNQINAISIKSSQFYIVFPNKPSYAELISAALSSDPAFVDGGATLDDLSDWIGKMYGIPRDSKCSNEMISSYDGHLKSALKQTIRNNLKKLSDVFAPIDPSTKPLRFRRIASPAESVPLDYH